MALSRENQNFSNISQGIVETGTAITQDTLAKFISSSDLYTTVRQHPIWNRLDRSQKLLISKAATNGYGNFDITFTYKLLRNVCANLKDRHKLNLPPPTRGWGKDPHPGDTRPSDDIERIRILKNTYQSHHSRSTLTDQEYDGKWQELLDICTRMQAYLGVDYPGKLRKTEDFPKEEINTLWEVLYRTNLRLTKQVPVSPLQRSDKKLPIGLIYAPVIIREDLESKYKEGNHEEENESVPMKHPKSDKSKTVNSPTDIFYKDGEPARYVFMQGDAGSGKSVYCLQLLKYWCSAKQPGERKEDLCEWAKGLGEFEFVFPVFLRHVNKHRSLLTDMICYDIFKNNGECHSAIRHVLSSGKYKCLVLMDGLDEWKNSPEAREELTYPHMPNVETMSCCTYFCSARPWKFDLLRELLDTSDRVIEIKGLDDKGVEAVIEKVLLNFFGMDKESIQFQTKFKEIKQKAKDKKLKSIMQIPLMVPISTVLWYREEKVADSMTGFYMALVKLLIKRKFPTQEVYDIEREKMNDKARTSDTKIPDNFPKNKTLRDFIVVLCTLGEIAYNDLISAETHLVFDRDDLEETIDRYVLEFALKVGLLSTSEAPGSLGDNMSLNFFHKTVQEFLAAVHIVCKNKVGAFRSHLSSISIIMELSNVIQFTSGLSPFLGSDLSQKIARVANTDQDFSRYRDSFPRTGYNKVRPLHDLQVSCYKEIEQGLSMSQYSEQLTYHVSDVFLDYTNRDTVRTKVDLMRKNPTHIVSLYVYGIPDDGEDDITDRELTQILDNATSLQYLCIDGCKTISTFSDRFTSLKTLHLESVTVTHDALCRLQRCLQQNTVLQSLTLRDIRCQDNASLRGVLLCLPNYPCLSTLHIGELYNTEDIQTLVDVLSKLKSLRRIEYVGTFQDPHPDDAAVVHAVSCMKQLQHLHLRAISLGDRSLELTSEMSQIEKIVLDYVKMSAGGWNKFVHSLINITHHFVVILNDTDIDDESVAMISSSPYFTVTRDEGWWELKFSKVTPSTKKITNIT